MRLITVCTSGSGFLKDGQRRLQNVWVRIFNDAKQQFYDDVLASRRKYISDLLPPKEA